jgi:hypothetical protein
MILGKTCANSHAQFLKKQDTFFYEENYFMPLKTTELFRSTYISIQIKSNIYYYNHNMIKTNKITSTLPYPFHELFQKNTN